MFQLLPQDAGLNRIQPAVVAFYVVVVLLRLTMVADDPDLGGDGHVIGRDCSGLAAGAEVLPWVEAEPCGAAHRTGLAPTILLPREVFGAVGLAGVFNDDQAILFGQFENWIHVHHLAVEMNRNNRRYRPVAALADQSAVARYGALRLEVLAELLRIHVVGPLSDVDKLGSGTGLRNRFSRCDKRVGYRHYYIALPDASGHQGKPYRVCAAADADGMLRCAERGERLLEVLDDWATNEARRPEGLLENSS